MAITDAGGRFASPPCLAGEIAPDYFDPMAVDPEQAQDVARWRKSERARLRTERQALSVKDLAAVGTAVAGRLSDRLFAEHTGFLEERREALPSLSDPDGVPAVARVVQGA